MIALIVIFILIIGAISTFFLPPQRRNLPIAVALVPAAALGVLLLRLPIRDSFSIAWSPAALFPEPLEFRSSTASRSFALYLCALLMLVEWTRPLRRSPGRSARLAIYLLTISGIAACFASNPLAVLVSWALIDFLCFSVTLFMDSLVEIGPGGISSSLSHSLSILALNMIGNILFIFAFLLEAPGVGLEWGLAWGGTSVITLPVILFLLGILFRLLLAPAQFASSHLPTGSIGTEILLRVVPPAAVLCLLANIWPFPQGAILAGWGFSWLMVPLFIILLAAGWQWCASSSPLGHRDAFFVLLPSFALLLALIGSDPVIIFSASGGFLILGGGILLVYLGYLSHRRWMAAFPVLLGLLFSGLPFGPGSTWSSAVYPVLLSPSGLVFLIPLLIGHIFLVSAFFRLAFEPVDSFPSNEPVFQVIFSAGMTAALLALLFPGWIGIAAPGSIGFPLTVLAGSGLLVFLIQRLFRAGTAPALYFEKIFRLEWLQQSILFTFQKTAAAVSGVEAFLSGEGAMLWSLGIALLLYLVFLGG
jgi:hypothetical protein